MASLTAEDRTPELEFIYVAPRVLGMVRMSVTSDCRYLVLRESEGNRDVFLSLNEARGLHAYLDEVLHD